MISFPLCCNFFICAGIAVYFINAGIFCHFGCSNRMADYFEFQASQRMGRLTCLVYDLIQRTGTEGSRESLCFMTSYILYCCPFREIVLLLDVM